MSGFIFRCVVFSVLLVLPSVGVLWAPLPASAQSSPYRSWQAPTTDFSERLRALVDAAEKANAADPQFLRDLRNLADAAGGVPGKLLVDDAFADGDFTRNPQWTLSAGKFWIEAGYGLRSAVNAAAPSQAKKPSREDKALAILGAVLQATGNAETPLGATAAAPSKAEIRLDVAVSNSFLARFEMASWAKDGRVELGVGQQAAGDGGYRLAYLPGGGWELLRVGGGGASVLKSVRGGVRLEDDKVHVIEWFRKGDGTITVKADGAHILSAVDRGYRDDFDRFMITNRGGDFTFRRVTLSGAK